MLIAPKKEVPFYKFLSEIYRMEASNEEEVATKRINSHVGTLLNKKQFDVVNEILKNIDLDKIAPELQIAFLSSTLSQKDKLPSRENYFNLVQNEIVKLQGWSVAMHMMKGMA